MKEIWIIFRNLNIVQIFLLRIVLLFFKHKIYSLLSDKFLLFHLSTLEGSISPVSLRALLNYDEKLCLYNSITGIFSSRATMVSSSAISCQTTL